MNGFIYLISVILLYIIVLSIVYFIGFAMLDILGL
ncbi:Uncharacterised protein [Staphylococcus aureus]|uniref:Uncharacterized protein n=1 Tax=Staphylococcus aureus TaxID=1280 RepID=Q8VVT6_STAAU|nr:hypothetical protein CGP84_02668 [Staphylococcus aureus]CAC6169969.1 Uncharacterised protein [Staphylococcus aureus]CAC6189755.1 Uncharacterised protein [Staphylococcus aureus]CAC6832738.1 Uncharacterised protein [Staphylococcus aureus]CAC7164044.1 Uncharacterised protein [Staphylococcus aureus]